MSKKDDRFVKTYSQGKLSGIEITRAQGQETTRKIRARLIQTFQLCLNKSGGTTVP